MAAAMPLEPWVRIRVLSELLVLQLSIDPIPTCVGLIDLHRLLLTIRALVFLFTMLYEKNNNKTQEELAAMEISTPQGMGRTRQL
jgi:hypothetical protein